MHDLACIVLCAGQGTRMKTSKPKVLHEAAGKPLCAWSLDLAHELGAKSVTAVLGHQRELVADALAQRYGSRVRIAIQDQQLGTGHAVQAAFKDLPACKRVLVLYGDTPLMRMNTLSALCAKQLESKAEIAMLTAHVKNPAGYGRMIREQGKIRAIVEERNANAQQKLITEINPGIYVFDYEFLKANLDALKANPPKGEYYLTDLIAMSSKPIESIEAPEEEILGVNDLVQLAHADQILRQRINEFWMLEGVEMLDPRTIYVDAEVKLSAGVILEQGVVLKGRCQIGSGSRIAAYSVLHDTQVGENCHVGPFARLRPETQLAANCKIGNFVEVKKSSFGAGSKASHLAYIGDAEVGEACNIGAGTITCNYDGAKKHKTQLDNGVFVGSNSTLVAPVHLKKDAYIGAGSVITQDVPSGALGLGRARQENKEGWVKKNNAKSVS